MMTRVVGIIQARMGSTRLPGKVLAALAGRPLILHVVERVQACPGLAAVVVTIPGGVEDDPLARVLDGAGVSYLRNQRPPDLLAAYEETARITSADLVMRVTADNPLWAPEIGHAAWKWAIALLGYAYYADVRHPGCDVEIIEREALDTASRWDRLDDSEREHVGPAVWRALGGHRCQRVEAPPGAHPWLSVDTAEDLARVRAVHAALEDPRDFTLQATLRAWEKAGRP
jgi:spore coat polysaccharide biosynthesis protein SpsF